MREIKFRAFVKHLRWMLRVESIDFIGQMVEVDLTGGEGDTSWYTFEEAELIQFTGLKDKNGVEIYEGDILKVWQDDEHTPNRDSGGGIIDYDQKEGFSQYGVVGFTGCSFDYKTLKTVNGRHEEIHAPIDWINNYENIGNIYENPELLEVSE